MIECLYERIGKERLKELVDFFYGEVLQSPIISKLFTGDMNVVREKQFAFLSQFLGGPQLYTAEYGHPRMRLRHMPHEINQEAMVEWLRCMKKAIDKLELSNDLATELYAVFPKVAQHMVNS